jgi:hypothetical protein
MGFGFSWLRARPRSDLKIQLFLMGSVVGNNRLVGIVPTVEERLRKANSRCDEVARQ